MKTAIEIAREYGTAEAKATHRNRDAATARIWRERERSLERANPEQLKTIAEAYCEAYRQEASNYIGRR